MKIIHCLSHYLPHQIAGTEVYVNALIRELRHAGITSKVLIPNYGKAVGDRYIFEETEVIRYAEPSMPYRELISGKKAPQGVPYFLETLQQENPDIVHFHELAGSNGLGLFHVKAAKAAGFKVLMTFHLAKYTCAAGTLMYMDKEKCDGIIRPLKCSKCLLNHKGIGGAKAAALEGIYKINSLLQIDFRFLKSSIGTALSFPKIIAEMQLYIKHTDGFIALTDWYKTILQKNGISENHVSLISQGVPAVYSGMQNKPKQNEKLRIIFIGRISPIKGVGLLIKALKETNMHSAELDIFGSSNDDAYYRECLSDTKDMKNVFWKGTIPHDEIIKTISAYDMVCIPSAVSEMGPFVLREAYAAGVPVLASDVYGNAEQITDNVTGWLFKFKSMDDLKLKLQMLIGNRELAAAASKSLPPVRLFTEAAKEHIELYQKILSS
jgi:glycosyltransferase involved in cell wall biosynthesis